MIYSNWLREKSHNAIKFGEAEGNPCALKYSKGKKLKNYEIYGNSVQETRSGKNLFKVTAVSSRVNGIWLTVFDNGGIRINGTNSSDTDDIIIDLGTFEPDKTATYMFSGGSAYGSKDTFYMAAMFLNEDENVYEVLIDNTGVSIDMSQLTIEFTKCKLSIIIKAGVTTSQSREFLPQIELGNTRTYFEPYGAMPSPEFSSEIYSVGDLTKNLFNANAEKYDFKVDSSGILSVSNYKTIFVNVENIQDFVVSSSFNENVYCGLCDEIGADATTYEVKSFVPTTTTYKITGNTHKYLGISLYYTKLSAFNTIQVEEGTTATEYEPYYNKYRIPIEVIKGKNLIDFKNVSSWNKSYLPFVSTYSYYQIRLHEIFPVGTTLTFHFGVTENIPPWLYMQTNDADLPVQSSGSRTLYFTTNSVVRNSLTFTIKEGCFYTLYPASNGINITPTTLQTWLNKFEYLQIELGTTQSGYEPYSAEITNIYLDEPLRAIGDYRDYIDYRNKKVVRNIRHFELKSSYSWDDRHLVKYNSIVLGVGGEKYYVNMSMGYPQPTNYSPAKSGYFNATNAKGTSIGFSLSAGNWPFTTLDELKAWLDTHDMYVEYPLATPIEESIDLPDIITNNREVCIIRTDTQVQPSNIKVKYIRV